MGISFLTPQGAIFAVSVVLTLGVYLGRERRAERIRSVLAVSAPSRAARTSVAFSLALVPALLALAATQPVIESTRTRAERTDAQAYFALDTSRSMLASARPGAPTRLERARTLATSLLRAFPQIPVGLAAFDVHMLPYTLPTTDARVLHATLRDSLGIERPQPLPPLTIPSQTTTLNALADVARGNYFAPSAQKRLLVVFTDGETNEVTASLPRAFQRHRPRIKTILVRFGSADERIYATGVAEPGYTPDGASSSRLQHAESLIGGRVFSEEQRTRVAAAAERILGSGPTKPRELTHERLALMPYVSLAALVPLAFLLWRRNV